MTQLRSKLVISPGTRTWTTVSPARREGKEEAAGCLFERTVVRCAAAASLPYQNSTLSPTGEPLHHYHRQNKSSPPTKRRQGVPFAARERVKRSCLRSILPPRWLGSGSQHFPGTNFVGSFPEVPDQSPRLFFVFPEGSFFFVPSPAAAPWISLRSLYRNYARETRANLQAPAA